MLHSYPWYPDDWRSSEDVVSMTLEQRGLYRELLDYCWQGGDLPADEGVLRRMARAEKREWDRAWPGIEHLFPVGPDGRRHHGKVDERRPELLQWHERRRESARRAARRRWQPDRVVEFPAGSSQTADPSDAKPSGGDAVPQLCVTHAPRMRDACGLSCPSTSTSTSASTDSSSSSSARARPRTACAEQAEPPPERDPSQEIAEVVDTLLGQHPQPGNRALAIRQAEIEAAGCGDISRFCNALRESHEKWTEWWTAERVRNRRAFVPQLHVWLRDRDYLAPPGKATQAKSRMELAMEQVR